MRKKNYKGRCEKRSVPKCEGVCRTYDALQSRMVDILSEDSLVKEIRCNVPMGDAGYTSDIVCTMEDGSMVVYECCYRNILKRPTTAKLLQQSRDYWLGHGVGKRTGGSLSMQKNELLRKDGSIIRILAAEGDGVLYIPCRGISSPMPGWCRASEFEDYSPCSEDELQEALGMELVPEDAPVLGCLEDEKTWAQMIGRTAKEHAL